MLCAMINPMEAPGPIRRAPTPTDDARREFAPADRAEARRILSPERAARNERWLTWLYGGDDSWLHEVEHGNYCVKHWVHEVEAYGSAEELGAARDLELWGPHPFDLEE